MFEGALAQNRKLSPDEQAAYLRSVAKVRQAAADHLGAEARWHAGEDVFKPRA